MITPQQYESAARLLQCEVAAVKAVTEVESNGSGFLADGRPKILFEGHIFWQQLLRNKIYTHSELRELQKQHESILYPTWTKQYYLGGTKEHDRLNEAIAINTTAALCSASWGAFQILGLNYELCGCHTIDSFVELMKSDEGQLYAFIDFIKNKKLAKYMQTRNWTSFALYYNGVGYKENKYDTRLAIAYAKYKKSN